MRALDGLISTRRAAGWACWKEKASRPWGAVALGLQPPEGSRAAAWPGWAQGLSLCSLSPQPASLPSLSPCLAPLGLSPQSLLPLTGSLATPLTSLFIHPTCFSLSLSPTACRRSPRPSPFKIIFRTPSLCAVSAQSLNAQLLRSGDWKCTFLSPRPRRWPVPCGGVPAHGH